MLQQIWIYYLCFREDRHRRSLNRWGWLY